MAEKELFEQLNREIDRMLGLEVAESRGLAVARPETSRLRDLATSDLAMLVVIASDLRGLPDPRFKQELKRRILPMTTMTDVRRPAGFGTVTPYLVGPDVPRLHAFLEQAFGAEVLSSVARPDGSIMHSEVRIGDSIVEIGQSEKEEDARQSELHLYVADADATYARAMAAGARSLSEPRDQPYGDREAGIADPIGNYWYIATHGAEVRPEGLRSVTPFLHARGAGAMIDFMKAAFDARETSRFADPGGTILHAVVHIGDSAIELGEAHGQYQPMPVGLHVFVGDPDAVYERALRAGARVDFPPSDAPYGQRIGGVIDQDGNRWFIAALL